MNELMPVTINEEGIPTVSGRTLHEFLEVKTLYKDWFPRMCEYGFTENIDFIGLAQNCAKPLGGRPEQDHALTIDMAKELAMLQRTNKGKQARQYFIQIEKNWNSPEMIMARALKIQEKTIQQLAFDNKIKDQVIGELRPKADYTDKILKSKGTVPVTAIAKDYGMSAQAFNKLLNELGLQYKIGDMWFLYSKYQAKGYTHSKSFDYEDSRGNPQTRMVTEWTQKGRLFLYDLLKQNEIIPLIEAA